MRKTITKEVKRTFIKTTEVQSQDGVLTGNALPDIEVMGSVTKEKANRIARKKYPEVETLVVDRLIEEVKVYEMPLDQFIELATEKVDQEA